MKTVLAIVAALALAVPAAAGSLGRDREQNQQSRIHDGVKDGELTRHEAKGLRKEQRHVDHLQKKAKCDGKVSRKEARHIDRAQDKANRDIARQKHDRQSRG